MRRLLVRTLATVAGIVGGLFCYFVCQGMFSGYPKYHSGLLSIAGMFLIVLIGGIAWILDERRMHDDD
jgi:H+/Cl- antiporter ClcA